MGTSKKDIEGQAKRQRETKGGTRRHKGDRWGQAKKERERESNKSDFSTLGIEYYQAPNLIACAWACWTEIDSRGIRGCILSLCRTGCTLLSPTLASLQSLELWTSSSTFPMLDLFVKSMQTGGRCWLGTWRSHWRRPRRSWFVYSTVAVLHVTSHGCANSEQRFNKPQVLSCHVLPRPIGKTLTPEGQTPSSVAYVRFYPLQRMNSWIWSSRTRTWRWMSPSSTAPSFAVIRLLMTLPSRKRAA